MEKRLVIIIFKLLVTSWSRGALFKALLSEWKQVLLVIVISSCFHFCDFSDGDRKARGTNLVESCRNLQYGIHVAYVITKGFILQEVEAMHCCFS